MMLVVKDPPANPGDLRELDLNPGSGRSPGGGSGNPLRGTWWATVHRITKSWTRLKSHSTSVGNENKGCLLLLISLQGLTDFAEPRFSSPLINTLVPPNLLQMVSAAMKLKYACSSEGKL